MSTSSCDALAQLTAIHVKHGIPPPATCGFAYCCSNTGIRHDYICMSPGGKLWSAWISYVTCNDSMHGKDGIQCVGIALKYISPSTNVQETIAALDESPLVAELRQAMAEGKFAPLFNPIIPIIPSSN